MSSDNVHSDATREKAVCAALETAGLHGVLTSHLSSPTVVTERHLWHLALCRTETLQLGSGVISSLHAVTDFGTAQISLSTEGLTVSVLHIALGFVLRPIVGLQNPCCLVTEMVTKWMSSVPGCLVTEMVTKWMSSVPGCLVTEMVTKWMSSVPGCLVTEMVTKWMSSVPGCLVTEMVAKWMSSVPGCLVTEMVTKWMSSVPGCLVTEMVTKWMSSVPGCLVTEMVTKWMSSLPDGLLPFVFSMSVQG